MKIDPTRCPLVITGAWNQAIFVPEFVEREVIGGVEKIRSEVSASPAGLVLRYSCARFVFVVQSDRVAWLPLSTEDDGLAAVEQSAVRLLSRLTVTPISGRGINFGFDLASPHGLLESVLKPTDQEALSKAGPVSSFAIRRTIPYEGCVFSIQIAKAAEQRVAIDINYHLATESAEGAGRDLDGTIRRFKTHCLGVLGAVYGLRLE